MYQQPNSPTANHYHVGINPTGMDPVRLLDEIVHAACALRDGAARKGRELKYITLSDRVGPGYPSFFLNAIIRQPKLMGPDCDIVGREGKYFAAYFDGVHGFDAIRFAEFRTDLGHVSILGPKREVLCRVDTDGNPTNELYSSEGNGSKIPNKPISFEDALSLYGDGLHVTIPHPTFMEDGIFRSSSMNSNGNRMPRLERIVESMRQGEIGWESFNASARWLERGSTLERFEQWMKKQGVPKGVVADDMGLDWIGYNKMSLWIPDGYVPGLQSYDEALNLLDARMEQAAAALKNGHFDILSRRWAPVSSMGRKVGKHVKWHAKDALRMAN